MKVRTIQLKVEKLSSFFICLLLGVSYFFEISIIPRSYISFMNNVVFIFAIIVILIMLRYNYLIREKCVFIPIIIYLIIGFFSVLMGYKYVGNIGLKRYLLTMINGIALINTVRILVKSQNNKLKNITYTLLIMHFVLTLFNLMMWFGNISILMFIEDRIRILGIRVVLQGTRPSYLLLYGLFRDSNYLATISIVSLIISVYFLINKKEIKTSIKILLITNILVQYMQYSLSNSRSNRLGIIVMTLSTLILVIKQMISFDKNLNTISRSIVYAMIFLALFTVGSDYTRNIATTKIDLDTMHFVKIGKFKKSIDYNGRDLVKLRHWDLLINREDDLNLEVDDAIVNMSEKEDVGGIGNGRIEIWKDTIKIWKNKKLLGYGTPQIQKLALETLGDSGKLARGYVLDNSYLEILVSYGLIGFIAWVIMLCCILVRTIIFVLKKQSSVIILSLSIFILTVAFFLSDYLSGNILTYYTLLVSLTYNYTNGSLNKKE